MFDQFDAAAEWLEADGYGGFASGTVGGERTRCYHALLLSATTPPTGRYVLVNGLEVWLETPDGKLALSTQRYVPDVVYPDGVTRLRAFERKPWPRWRFALSETQAVDFELLVTKESRETILRWRMVPLSSEFSAADSGIEVAIAAATADEPAIVASAVAGMATSAPSLASIAGATLKVRLLMSGRDYHGLHHQNPVFDFGYRSEGAGNIGWHPYGGLPSVAALTNGRYEHAPEWFRQFLYLDERARGLDDSEDLASPGVFSFDLASGDAVMILRTGDALDDEATARAATLAQDERGRRDAFGADLERSADTYLVARASGQTVLAGFPWFTDWGRDTFIAMRGLMLATGRFAQAEAILLGWATVVSEGMMPNRFPDDDGEPEYNSVDASLWFVIAVHDYLASGHASPDTRARLQQAVGAILDGYARGTRFGIAADADGLIRAGVPGVQLTWMDAKVGDWVVTPRIGKPVEIQALWVNALRIAGAWTQDWRTLEHRANDSFRERFVDPSGGGLFDVVDADHESGKIDRSIRSNQIFAVGGLPFALLDQELAHGVVAQVEAELLTPFGLRSLSARDPAYIGRYEGDRVRRDGAYHQGTVWPWLSGAFVHAWLRVHGSTAASRDEAVTRFLAPLRAHLNMAGLGHVSEIADGDAPNTPRGAPFQAWSLGEMIRIEKMLAP